MPQGTPERANVGRLATKPDPAVAAFGRLPLAIDNAAPLATAINLSLLLPTLGVMFSPALWLAATAMPALAAAGNPLAAIHVVAGLGLWPALFIVAARGPWQRFGSQRRVPIAGGIVSVGDRAILTWPIGARSWQWPSYAFRGGAYRVRSWLAGVRRERLLVHIDAGKSLPPHGANTICAAAIAAASALLGLPLLAVTRHRQGVGAGRRPLSSLWRSLCAHPFLIRPPSPARRRHQPQRSVGGGRGKTKAQSSEENRQAPPYSWLEGTLAIELASLGPARGGICRDEKSTPLVPHG